MIAIEAGCVVTPARDLRPGVVVVQNGQFKTVGHPSETPIPSEAEVINVGEKAVLPGFIDTHTHGGEGTYFGESSESTAKLCKSVVKTGVTSILPTLASLLPVDYTLDMILDSIRVIRKAQDQQEGAEILGIHMEGPFLSSSETARGSQLVSNMRRPSVEELLLMLEASDHTIRKMTIAPELEGSLEVIGEMVKHRVVPSAGHSTASFQEALAAVRAGLCCATHTFNAMIPLHHRRPGLLGAVLTIDEISAELIADGQHVAAEAMDILIRCKGKNGVHLVTDNTIWAGLPDGTYRDGDRQIIKEGPKAYVKGGTLIGSVAPMNQFVANLVQLVGCSLREASRMASLNAAVLLGIDGTKGSIERGKDADLVVLEEDFRVYMTMVKGKILYPSEQTRITLQ